MMWGWQVVHDFPGAIVVAWGLFAFWGVALAAAVHEAESRQKQRRINGMKKGQGEIKWR
jgi:hypothetical protein